MARGDHIYIISRLHGIRFQHHGIAMGDGTVIHLAPSQGARVALRDISQNFSVRRDSIEDFSLGAEVLTFLHSDARNAEDIAQAAEAALGKTGYSLLDGNCEHFATLCATGRAASYQIEMSEATLTALASMATKAFWSVGSRLSAKALVRSASKVHPAAMLADGIEIATLMAGCRSGLSSERSKRLAKLSGNVAAAGIGGIMGGPAGAAVGIATHTSANVVAESVCQSVRKILNRSRDLAAPTNQVVEINAARN